MGFKFFTLLQIRKILTDTSQINFQVFNTITMTLSLKSAGLLALTFCATCPSATVDLAELFEKGLGAHLVDENGTKYLVHTLLGLPHEAPEVVLKKADGDFPIFGVFPIFGGENQDFPLSDLTEKMDWCDATDVPPLPDLSSFSRANRE